MLVRFPLVLCLALLALPVRAVDIAAVEAKVESALAELEPALGGKGAVVVVPPFRTTGEAADLELGPAFTGAAVSALRALGVEVRDPAALKQVLGEAALQEALGGAEVDVSRLAVPGATVLLLGQLGVLGDVLVLDLKAVDATRASVLAAASRKVPMRHLRPASGGGPRAYTGEGPDETVELVLRRLADDVAAGVAGSAKDGDLRYLRAAVVDFQENGAGARDRELGKVVSAELATNLQRDHGLLLVERSRIRQILAEQALGDTGVIDPTTAAKLGQILGVRVLVLGDVSEVGDHFRIAARAVDSLDARILTSVNRSVPVAGLVALSADSVVLRSRSGATFRSVLIPGWGQFYNREPVKGGVFLGTGLALGGAALAFHVLGTQAESDYRLGPDAFRDKYAGEDLAARAESLRLEAERDYTTRNTLLYVVAGVWAYNVLDAWLNGAPTARESGLVVVPAATPDGAGFAAAFSW